MATYNDLKVDTYYLIKETAEDEVTLVYVLMNTRNAVFLEIEDGLETLAWKKRAAAIHEIVDELSDDEAELYESIVYEEEDDDDLEWDDEDDDGVIPIHN